MRPGVVLADDDPTAAARARPTGEAFGAACVVREQPATGRRVPTPLA